MRVSCCGRELDGRQLGQACARGGRAVRGEHQRLGTCPAPPGCEARGLCHDLSDAAADALSDALGADLAALCDALDRLSLYVGAGKSIAEEHVQACVAHVRIESVWSLVDAVGEKNARKALTSAASLLSDREPPLRILALVARQLRTLAKLKKELATGLKPQEATRAQGRPRSVS